MQGRIEGIHHVTAIAGDPQANVDFYAGVLGLRLVKKTVNFDDPGTYHLYFGDKQGSPGTIMTFFPWPGSPRGRHGAGQMTATSFSVPEGSLSFWAERLRNRKIPATETMRFGQRILELEDPDGLALELVAERTDAREPWREGIVPGEHAIRGFHHATLTLEGYERTGKLLDLLGFRLLKQEGARYRYATGEATPGGLVDLECAPESPRGHVARGAVHHIAWRAKDRSDQEAWRAQLAEAGVNVTPILDRQYFTSIYFREPGGVLFEIATDPPGFDIDETESALGTRIMLPPWLEGSREALEARLPPLTTPGRHTS